jgi:hypothetical protein
VKKSELLKKDDQVSQLVAYAAGSQVSEIRACTTGPRLKSITICTRKSQGEISHSLNNRNTKMPDKAQLPQHNTCKELRLNCTTLSQLPHVRQLRLNFLKVIEGEVA